MSLIAIIGQFDIHPDDTDSAADLMRVMMNESMKEQGCHHYTYSRDLSTPDRFQLSELWESDEALAGHFKTLHMTTYRAGMANLRVVTRKVRRFDVTNATDL